MPSTNRATKEERWHLWMWTCRIIWKKRCKPNPTAAVEEAKKLYVEYKNIPKVTNEVQRPRNSQGWEAPETGYVKVNCDASWCRQTKTGGLRVVARNSDGRLTEGANRRETRESVEGNIHHWRIETTCTNITRLVGNIENGWMESNSPHGKRRCKLGY